MSRTVTLAQLRTDIAAQADIVSGTGRYDTPTLNRFINQSIQRFRERLSNEGATHFLVSTTGNLGVGATSPFPFYSLDLSAVSPSIVRSFGIDITLPGNVIKSLPQVPFASRTDYGGAVVRGEPIAWAHYQTRKLAIMPGPNSAYPYVVWYLPVLADLAADDDTFDGVAGWEDFIVWDVVCRLIIRDQYMTAYQTATAYRNEVWADILRNATRVSRQGGANLARDSMGERAATDNWRRNRYLPPP